MPLVTSIIHITVGKLIYFPLKINPECSRSIMNNQKNIKLQPVPPSMASEALSVWFLVINSASGGTDGGTGCNLYFFA